MRVVVLSLADPWAASHGGTLRTRALVAALIGLGHEVVAVFPQETDVAPGTGTAPPEGVRVVAVPSTTVGNRAWPGWVRRAKRVLVPLPTAVGARSAGLSRALSGLGDVDLLLVSVLPFAQYLQQLPGARLWVDHSDLYSDVLGREAARRRGLARLTAGAQHRGVRRTETGLARTAAVTTAAGHEDARQLAARSSHAVTWLPTPVAFADVPRDPAPRPVAGFLGNFHYWPNRDAWDLLASVWAPRLRAAGWDVVVAGLGSERLVEEGAANGIEVLGPVAEPADLYRRVDVTLAPVRVGGGMKVKVVESLSHGRPVVATPFAVAGFPGPLARATTVVDAQDPDFSALAEGVPALPPEAAEGLRTFTADSFRATVEQLVGAAAGAPLPSARP